MTDLISEKEPLKQTTTTRRLRLGITQGDTNGVGYEVIFKVFSDPMMCELCTPIVYGSAKVATAHRQALGIKAPFQTITTAMEAKNDRLNLIDCCEEEIPVEFGKVSSHAGRAALLSLEQAVSDYRVGNIDAIVTAPINKWAIQSDDFTFKGHTEYLADRFEAEVSPLMILCSDSLRVALATTHLPLREVAGALSEDLLLDKLKALYHSLRHDFLVPDVRIAVLSLNPHAGDEGLIGKEEIQVITPAIERAQAEGVSAYGPYAADGFFGKGLYRHFDAVLAMYHDQGLAPFKALSAGEGVNFTAGLDCVRTSPDHGTAFDIAGTGKADERSFRKAVYMAIDIVRNRRFDAEATAHPLPKLYQEHREDAGRHRRPPLFGSTPTEHHSTSSTTEK